MNARLQKFEALKTHPMYRKQIQKLNDEEFGTIQWFCKFYADRNQKDFEMLGNRLYLDKPKSKNWVAVVELISVISYVEKI